MTCPLCAGPVELPEPTYPAWCPRCDQYFRLVADFGWWGYTAEVYALEGE